MTKDDHQAIFLKLLQKYHKKCITSLILHEFLFTFLSEVK